jgi:hypothetical protein
MADIIPWLQFARALAWLVVFVINVPGLLRLVTGRARGIDATRAGLTLAAAAEIYFSSHWWFYPAPLEEMGGLGNWAGAYILSILSAGMLAWVVDATENARSA